MRTLTKAIITFFLSVLLLVASFYAWQAASKWSYKKLSPYQISFMLKPVEETAKPSSTILNVHYDYGYGFIPMHVKTIKLSNEYRKNQTIGFSVSAWKKVKRLQFSTPDAINNIVLQNLAVRLNNFEMLPINFKSNLLIEVNKKKPVVVGLAL